MTPVSIGSVVIAKKCTGAPHEKGMVIIGHYGSDWILTPVIRTDPYLTDMPHYLFNEVTGISSGGLYECSEMAT